MWSGCIVLQEASTTGDSQLLQVSLSALTGQTLRTDTFVHFYKLLSPTLVVWDEALPTPRY